MDAFENIHIGKYLKKRLYEKKVNKRELSRTLGLHRNTIYNMFDQRSIDAVWLAKISEYIGENLFDPYLKAMGDEKMMLINELRIKIQAKNEVIEAQKKHIKDLKK